MHRGKEFAWSWTKRTGAGGTLSLCGERGRKQNEHKGEKASTKVRRNQSSWRKKSRVWGSGWPSRRAVGAAAPEHVAHYLCIDRAAQHWWMGGAGRGAEPLKQNPLTKLLIKSRALSPAGTLRLFPLMNPQKRHKGKRRISPPNLAAINSNLLGTFYIFLSHLTRAQRSNF